MGHRAVDDVGRGHAAADRLHARAQLGESGSSGFASQPAISVRKIALCASSAAATLPAAVSALTL